MFYIFRNDLATAIDDNTANPARHRGSWRYRCSRRRLVDIFADFLDFCRFAACGQIKKHRKPVVLGALHLVDDTGLEPVTLRTSSGCSYQLS